MTTRAKSPKADGAAKKGRLVIVGTGLKAISHMTQEAVAHIRNADAVFYHAADGVTAAYIHQLNPQATDLYQLYGNGKMRRKTYVQMAELLLRALRQGKYVVGVFYGHPGLFVSPARRALVIAEREGFETALLPGISSTDYLFSDLRIDPSTYGCQLLEATQFLLYDRPLVTSGHVVLMQVGAVGDRAFSFKGYQNAKRDVLFQRLIEIYGGEHEAILYTGSVFPGVPPTILTRPLKEFLEPAMLKRATGNTTLVLPPAEKFKPNAEMFSRLGYDLPAAGAVEPKRQETGAYGAKERAAVAELDTQGLPEGFRLRMASKPLVRAMNELATNGVSESLYRRRPVDFVNARPDLSRAEREALLKGSPRALHNVSSRKVDAATGAQSSSGGDAGAIAFLNACNANPSLMTGLLDEIESQVDNPDGEAEVNAWIVSQGYATTLSAISEELGSFALDLALFYGMYQTAIGDSNGPVITITQSTTGVTMVQITDQNSQTPYTIASPNWDQSTSTLSWTNDPSTGSSASLTLTMLISDTSVEIEDGDYVGGYISGMYWTTGQNEPTSNNIVGKVNVYSVAGLTTTPTTVDAVSYWVGTYNCSSFASDPAQNPSEQPTSAGTLVIGQDEQSGLLTVTYNSTTINSPSLEFNVLSWTSADNNTSSCTVNLLDNFYGTTDLPVTGKQFFGQYWAEGSAPNFTNFIGNIEGAPPPPAGGINWKNVLQIAAAVVGIVVGLVVLGQAVYKLYSKLSSLWKQGNAGSNPDVQEAMNDADVANEPVGLNEDSPLINDSDPPQLYGSSGEVGDDDAGDNDNDDNDDDDDDDDDDNDDDDDDDDNDDDGGDDLDLDVDE